MRQVIYTVALLAIMGMIGLASVLLIGKINDDATTIGQRAARNNEARAMSAKKNVAIFIHEGVELLDFAGPGEVFAAADSTRAFNVYTVAASAEPIVSQGFVTIKPQYTFANCPPPDIVILPGGRTDVPLNNPSVIKWIQQTAQRAEVMMSVCTGAFLLGKAGLLDGREATTHWKSLEALKESAPKTTVRENRRFVDNGQVVTAAGVSAGIDASLHVVDKLLGREVAEKTARYMEYKWVPET